MIDEGAELPPPLETQTANTVDTVNTLVNAPPLPTRARILLPSIIIPFSIMGLLIRLGLVSIETFAGQQVFALAWPQFIGCLLMGLFVSTRGWIDGAFVYIGLSSGLCGSITTFSSWNLALFNELINTANVSRHPLQNILSALTELVATLALSISGLQLGYHLGEALLQLATNWGLALTPPSPPVPPNRWTILDIVIVSAAIILWTGVICAAILVPRESRLSWRRIVLACCFAPAGAILRWYLSRFNSRSKLFPLGTFAANLGGSIILAAIVCLQHTSAAGGKSTLICHVLSGLQDGFCGCLTTISTFALEIKSLPRRASYVYGVVSVVVTQVFMLLIVGSYMWTRNSDDYVMACTS
ncbi:CrcB-like protein-domain-containing protein [Linnemannia elongata]|nr:CrcB-like protein-domain-containing protein [Linnemannia elongata]